MNAATFTAKTPCRRDHLAPRYVSNGICIECSPCRRRDKALVSVQNLAWRTRNREHDLEHKRKWAKSHSDRAVAWAIANPEKMRPLRQAARQNYRARRCAACGEIAALTVDHIVALARGGSNLRRNLQMLCASCNARKRSRTAEIFMRELGYLV